MTFKPSPRRARLRHGLLIALASLVGVLTVSPGVALAHTSFVSSSPAEGETIAAPVDTITIEFSGVSEPAADGFTVLMPDGRVRTPTSIVTADQKVFDLTFEPPLAGGTVGLRWSVSAPDAHPITGAFSFDVTAPAALTGESTDGATSGVAANPVESPAADAIDPTAMSGQAGMSMDEFMAAPPPPAGDGTARLGRIVEFAALTLLIGGAAFAATTLRGRREEIDRTITVLRVLGALLVVGAVMEYVGVARIAGASVGSYWSSSPGFATLLRGGGGVAIGAGLVAVTAPVRSSRPANSLSAGVNQTTEYEREEVAGFSSDDERHRTPHGPIRRNSNRIEHVRAQEHGRAIDPLVSGHPRSTGTEARAAGRVITSPDRPRLTISTALPARTTRRAAPRHGTQHPQPETSLVSHAAIAPPVIRRWVADRTSIVAYVGAAVAIISFWFDGHTVSKGFRPLHAVVNTVHVTAGAVWIGGVVAMAVVLWTRHRAGIAPRALEMVVRFSGIAAASLAAVLAAGGLMAFIVLDSLGELFSTEWGKVLLLKSAAVGLALVGGAYNHFRVLPHLEAHPDDPQMVVRLRSVVTSEAIVLGFVIVITASLVAAAS